MKKTKYVYRNLKSGHGVSADVAGIELANIRESHGALTASIVVDASRPDSAPLHPVFEWDDFSAAENHRRWQARQLIRAVHVVSGQNESRPVYVHVGSNSVGEIGGYHPVDVVVKRADLYARALSELRVNLQSAQNSVNELEQAAKGSPDVDRDSLARIGLAVQALQTASAVVQALH